MIDFGGRMGGGMQIPVVDIDGDGDLDLICAGKSGLFLAENVAIDRGRRALRAEFRRRFRSIIRGAGLLRRRA